jgi:hypothetical protein
VATFIREHLGRMHSRYGSHGTFALLAATVALAVIPIPGLAFLPISIAELTRKTWP